MLNKKIISMLIIFVLLFTSCNVDKAPLSPKAKDNSEMMSYIPLLINDFPSIEKRLEILRLGQVGQDGYIITYISSNDENIYITLPQFPTNDTYSLLSDNLYNLPEDEINAVNFLFLSNTLFINAKNIRYSEPEWDISYGTQGAKFASTENGDFSIGIFYFPNNEVPKELQNNKDYVEEIKDNYWIVVCNSQ